MVNPGGKSLAGRASEAFALQIVVYFFPQNQAGLEGHHPPSLNLAGYTRLGIPAGSGYLVPQGEISEAG